jgi:glycosyltransferase involved in cell wall biosynthesis
VSQPEHLQGRDIVCVSNHYWDERWYRKQEFMSRFGRDNRVLFVEPSFSMVRPPEVHLRDLARNRQLRPIVTPRDGGVQVFTPPRGLPKWTDPRIERLTYQWYGRLIARAAARMGMRDIVLWVYRPAYAHAVDQIPHSQLVFDLTDDLTAYERPGSERFDYVERLVTDLARRSDLLVVTASTLRERYGALARRAELIPNGFDARVFSPEAARAKGEPRAIRDIPHPRLGFIGTLFTFLDFDLLEDVAARHSDKSLVLVGPVEATAQASLDHLLEAPNVHHVGSVPQSDVPSYIASFDVCLNAFKVGRAADSISPLKVFEYLAMGVPVVSTRMRALEAEPAAVAVSFADDAASFSERIDECLAASVQARADDRRAAVAGYSWSALFDRLDRIAAGALGPSPVDAASAS